MKTKKLYQLAKTLRSKNAGVDRITFDIIFNEEANYHLVKKSKVLTVDSVARIFNVSIDRICDFVEYDPAFAIKFTIQRKRPSGSPGEGDIFGCQQYPPLLDIEIPMPSE
jgi:hypothetical protein